MNGSTPFDPDAEAAHLLQQQGRALKPTAYWEAHARQIAREMEAATDRGEHVLAAALDAALTVAIASRDSGTGWPTR